MLPKTRIRRLFQSGRWWWAVDDCRCYGRDPHSHLRYTANSAWLLVRVARNWHDKHHPTPSPAGITNDEAVALYGTASTERIN